MINYDSQEIVALTILRYYCASVRIYLESLLFELDHNINQLGKSSLEAISSAINKSSFLY